MKEDKRTINGVKQKKQIYVHTRMSFAHNVPKKIKIHKPKNAKQAILKDNAKKAKKIYTCQKMHKIKVNKNKCKRKILKAYTIPDARLTEPKKRSLLRRIMLRMKYNRGAFDYIENDYNNLTRTELNRYQNSKKRADKRYYKEVQQYEDAIDDVTVKKGWMMFKIGLATIMLCTAIGLTNYTIKDIQNSAPQEINVITIQDASELQTLSAEIEMSSLKSISNYNFENLTSNEQIDALLRLKIIQSKIPEGLFKNAIYNFQDQELLEQIVKEAFGEEYSSYSDGKKFDLKKLAYEVLDEEKKDLSRDPQLLAELAAKQKAKEIEREKKQAAVEESLNSKSETNQDEMEL